MRHLKKSLLILILAVLLLSAAPNLRGQANAPSNNWTERLEALDPAEPLAYFQLAEEIADAATDQRDSDLARRLFALSAVIAPQRFGASACIALADMAEDEHQRRRFAALASLLAGGSRAGALGEHVRAGWHADEGALLGLGDALSFYRRGAANRASSRLQRADAVDLLLAVEHALPDEVSRALSPTATGRATTPHGARPPLRDLQVTQMLQLEAALLAGQDRTWSSDLVLTASNPLIEVDPAQLAESLNVDATLLRYRNGRWVE